MTTRIKVGSYLACVLGALCLGVIFYFVAQAYLPSGLRYDGKEVFQSEAEYLEFKNFLAPEGVRIERLELATSNPPIIADFEVTTPQGYYFPYGVETNNWSPEYTRGYGLKYGGVVGFAFLLVFLFFTTLFLSEQKAD